MFDAAMQPASASGQPVLMKVKRDGGQVMVEKTVSFKGLEGHFAFLLWRTGHEDFQPWKQAGSWVQPSKIAFDQRRSGVVRQPHTLFISCSSCSAISHGKSVIPGLRESCFI